MEAAVVMEVVGKGDECFGRLVGRLQRKPSDTGLNQVKRRQMVFLGYQSKVVLD